MMAMMLVRQVRRRVGPTREESRAVTIDEPETEELSDTLPQAPPPDPPPDGGGGVDMDIEQETADVPDPEEDLNPPEYASETSYHVRFPDLFTSCVHPDDQGYDTFRAFMASRSNDKDAKAWKQKSKFASKKAKEKQGKLLIYHKQPTAVQRGLDASRQKEWQKWQDFDAAIKLTPEQFDELRNEGHQVIPTQWIETDKNEPLRTKGKDVEPLYKSRLVVRGDLEQGDLRSDSPTADIEAQNLIFSFAASEKVPIRSLDVTNAYFQGESIDRVLILSQPKGGLPGMNPEEHLLARAPVYGSHDGGRRFWKRLRNAMKKKGARENQILSALYSFTDSNGKLLMLVCTHVDDLLWAAHPEGQALIDELINEFNCGKVEEKSFRYCGKEVTQADDFSITVTCRDTTLKVRKIPIAKGRHPGDPMTPEDTSQMKSVAGSLAWVSRQCRPDLAYRVSRIQSAANKGIVADIKEANKAVDFAIATAERGLTFKSGTVKWGEMISLVITDASHANESEEMIVAGKKSLEPHRSQGARMVFLASKEIWDGDSGHIHPISYSSTIVRRVCRSTIQAEAYTLQAGVEEGDRIRAAIADLYGVLDLKKWEASSASFMQQLWMTDCRSLSDTMMNPKCQKHSDKRLSIEIAALRQSLWRRKGEAKGDPQYEDTVPNNPTDKIRWIDTDVMIADPLTKLMESTKLSEAIETNWLDTSQPIDSVIKKRAKQLQRRKRPLEEGAGDEKMSDS